MALFLLKVTVPILYKTPNGDHIATGTIFEIDNSHYLVTARHVFDNREVKEFAIPSTPTGSDLRPLGRFILHRPADEAIDIAVLELQDTATINAVKKGWMLLKPAHAAIASLQGVFLLCGYPSELIKVSGQRLDGTLLTAYTARLNEVPKDALEPVDERLDLFFHHAKEGTVISGKPIFSPHLGGTSGSSVWEYYESASQSVWTPESSLRIIGIQSSFLKGQFIRVKSWGFVIDILQAVRGSSTPFEIADCAAGRFGS